MGKYSFKKNKLPKLGIIALAVFIILVLSPLHTAHAGSWFGDWAQSSIFDIVGGMAVIIMGVISGLIGVVGRAIDLVFSIQITGSDVVRNSWEIVRGFANMFFIIALIIMAFSTIFSISKYDFRTLIVRFLIAVLLINFSLVIGEIIINWSQSLADVFKQAIGDIGARIAQGANLGARFQPPSSLGSVQSTTLDASIWGRTISAFGDIIMLSIILFSMVVMLFFVIVRVPVLWALLILSPIAWITYILPTTQKYNKMWWEYFMSWNLFLPIYLFFIYFGTLFLSKKPGMIPNGATQLIAGMGLSLDDIFFYMLIALFLIGGAKMAISSSRAGGAGAVAGWAYGKGAVMRRAAWRRTPMAPMYEAAKQRISQIQKNSAEGFQGRQSVWAERFGVSGEGLKAQQVFVNKSNKTFEELKQKLDLNPAMIDDIRKRSDAGSATNPEVYAARKILAMQGQLDETTYAKTLKELSNNPYAAQDFAKTAKESKFSNLNPEHLLAMTAAQKGTDSKGNAYDYTSLGVANLTPARKEQIRHIMSDKKLTSKLSADQYRVFLGLMGGRTTKEGKEFVRTVGEESRPDLVIDHRLNSDGSTDTDRVAWAAETRGDTRFIPIMSNPALNATQKDEAIKTMLFEDYLKEGKDIANLKVDVWRRPEFQAAVAAKVRRLVSAGGKAAPSFVDKMNSNIVFAENSTEKQTIFGGILASAGYVPPAGRRRGTPPPGTPPPSGTTPPPGGTPPPPPPGTPPPTPGTPPPGTPPPPSGAPPPPPGGTPSPTPGTPPPSSGTPPPPRGTPPPPPRGAPPPPPSGGYYRPSPPPPPSGSSAGGGASSSGSTGPNYGSSGFNYDDFRKKEEARREQEAENERKKQEENKKHTRAKKIRADFDRYYATLGIDPSITSEELEKTYKKLVAENHPDKFTDLEKKKEREEKMKDITEAYREIYELRNAEMIDKKKQEAENKSASQNSPPPRYTPPGGQGGGQATPKNEAPKSERDVEDARIYPHPGDDPKIGRVFDDIKNWTDRHVAESRKMGDKRSDAELYRTIRSRASEIIWDNFIRNYPEKAATYRKYGEDYPEINDAFERVEHSKKI